MSRSRTVLSRVRPAALALLTAAAFSCGGCTQMFAWTMAAFAPPKKIEPLYKPPPDAKVLIFVDNVQPLSWEPVKHDLSDRIGRRLIEHKAVREVIPYDRVQDLSTRPDFATMPSSVVGQKLGADLVIYVRIDGFSLRDQATGAWQGQLSAGVWVVDCKKHERLWPKGVTSQAAHQMPLVELKPSDDPSPTYGAKVAEQLAEQMADRVAKLFYQYEEDPYPHHDPGSKQPY